MKVIANGTPIPGVESVYADHLYLGDTTRNALHLKISEALTPALWEALLCGSLTVGEGKEAESHAGYNSVHACEVTLIRADDAERTVAELHTQLAAAQSGQEEVKAALGTAKENQAVLCRTLAPRMTDAEVLALDPVWPEWKPDTAYEAQDVLRHGGKLYRVVQAHASQRHQEPSGAGLLAIYRPMQEQPPDGADLPWVSGEEIVQGDRRTFDGLVYECTHPSGAGANTYPPDQVPAVWTVVDA